MQKNIWRLSHLRWRRHSFPFQSRITRSFFLGHIVLVLVWNVTLYPPRGSREIVFFCRAASGCRPKLHSRAESLSMESLDKNSGNLEMSRENQDMCFKNLNIPNFDRDSLDIKTRTSRKWLSRHSLPKFGISRHSRTMSRLSWPNFGMSRLRGRDSWPKARLICRLSRIKLWARLCNFGLNPDVARPLESGVSLGPRPGQMSHFETRKF